jgi:hypothetical protein
MNSLTITPFEQASATALTGLYCIIGAKGVPATILKRANTALAVGNALATLATGDVASASAAILAAVQNNPNLDPAIALAIKSALQVELTQWQAFAAIEEALPFSIAPDIETAIGNFAKGVIAGANAEIAKYQQSSSTSTAATATSAQQNTAEAA